MNYIFLFAEGQETSVDSTYIRYCIVESKTSAVVLKEYFSTANVCADFSKQQDSRWQWLAAVLIVSQ